MFEPDKSLFKNRDTLKETYVPNTIVGRDEEIDQYQASLQPVINGEHPDNIFVYGKPGVGKTAVTKYLLSEVKRSALEFDVPLSVIYNVCKGQNTSYQAAISIINEIRGEGEDVLSETGHPESKVYRLLWDELSKLSGAVIIVLDEVDYISDDMLLYHLTRGSSNDSLNQVMRDEQYDTEVETPDQVDEQLRIGVIGISNDTAFRDRLGGQVKSSLSEKSISFPAYNANELREVLSHRADLAFHDGALEDDVVPLCAAYGAKDGGDARHAIELLLSAGDLARNAKSDKVTTDHVETAKDLKEKEEIISVIETLSEHEKLALYAVAILHEQGETPARSREVYDVYTKICASHSDEKDPRTLRRIRDYLSDFNLVNITESTRIEGGDTGKHSKHSLNLETSTIVGAISSTIKDSVVHSSIKQYLTLEDDRSSKDASFTSSEQSKLGTQTE